MNARSALRLFFLLALLVAGGAGASRAQDSSVRISSGGAPDLLEGALYFPALQPGTFTLPPPAVDFAALGQGQQPVRFDLSFTPETVAGFNALRGRDTLTGWGAGGQVGFDVPYAGGALLVGGSYWSEPTFDIDGLPRGMAANFNRQAGDVTRWNAGLKYAIGHWTIGGSYQIGDNSLLGAFGASGGRAYAVEGGYNLGPGIAVSAGVQFWDSQNSGDNLRPIDRLGLSEGKYTVIFLETAVDF